MTQASKLQWKQNKKGRNVHVTTQDDSEEKSLRKDSCFHTTSAVHKKGTHVPLEATEAYAKIQIGTRLSQIEVNAEVNTSAISNLTSLNVFKQLKGVSLKDIPTQMIVFGGFPIKQAGVCCWGIRYGTLFTNTLLHVVKSKGPILLGLQPPGSRGNIQLYYKIKNTTQWKATVPPDRKKLV